MRRWAGWAGLALLGSCVQPPAPLPQTHPKYYVGNPFQSGGKWEYPQNFGSYDVTGLSTLLQDDRGAITANGEAFDPGALQAASAVLQLPAIVSITNLVNGRTVDVRVNDRLVNQPGRVIGVTPEVARVLGFPTDGVVEVQVVLNVQRTAAIDGALGEGPKLTAAPEAGIQVQALGAPGEAAAQPARQLGMQTSADDVADTGTLSGRVTAVPPAPGPLWVQIPGFGRGGDARQTMAYLFGLPAMVVPVFGGDRTFYSIKIGPYHAVADADAALATVLQRGVTDPEIIVR